MGLYLFSSHVSIPINSTGKFHLKNNLWGVVLEASCKVRIQNYEFLRVFQRFFYIKCLLLSLNFDITLNGCLNLYIRPRKIFCSLICTTQLSYP